MDCDSVKSEPRRYSYIKVYTCSYVIVSWFHAFVKFILIAVAKNITLKHIAVAPMHAAIVWTIIFPLLQLTEGAHILVIQYKLLAIM